MYKKRLKHFSMIFPLISECVSFISFKKKLNTRISSQESDKRRITDKTYHPTQSVDGQEKITCLKRVPSTLHISFQYFLAILYHCHCYCFYQRYYGTGSHILHLNSLKCISAQNEMHSRKGRALTGYIW